MPRLVLLLALLLLTGCSLLPAQRVADPEIQATEAAQHDGDVCPGRLPIGADPDGYGFGPEEPADALPSLLTPERAWVCRYDLALHGRSWPRDGEVRELDESRIGELADALDGLATLPREYGCTSELGPRWLVVYEHGGDLTGVVVDDYGCDFARVTDQPFMVAAGQSDGPGMVRGVLDGGHAVLDVLDR